MSLSNEPLRVAVIGGGPAGLAAAERLVRGGAAVELFESHRRLGGRARSYFEPAVGRMVDGCRHVVLGCCGELLDFFRRADVLRYFQTTQTFFFYNGRGQLSRLCPSRWLPPPLHWLPGLWQMRFLDWNDRLLIARALNRLRKTPPSPRDDQQLLAAWLEKNGQSPNLVRRFWEPFITAALAASPDAVSLSAGRQVFVEGFFGSRRASTLYVARIPLGEVWDQHVGAYLEKQNVVLHRDAPVERIEPRGDGRVDCRLTDGSSRPFDAVVAAVPWYRLDRLLPEGLAESLAARGDYRRLTDGAIASVQLWFDRPIAPVPHAVLLERLAQWVFFEPARIGDREGVLCEVVVSAAEPLAAISSDRIMTRVLEELASVWPAAAEAILLHGRVLRFPRAVFVMRPGAAAHRPAAGVSIGNIYPAGDWMATGWPATMEGAVRSGRVAAEAILQQTK